jgi:hypothetical protein
MSCGLVFCWVGLLERIVSDRDTRLTASAVRSLCALLQILLRLSVAYHPQSDGQSEVFNRPVLELL